MSEKTLKSRIIHKHDTEANWLLATNFIPKKGELIVYDVDSNHSYERFKIGDGSTVVSNLPFSDDQIKEGLPYELELSESLVDNVTISLDENGYGSDGSVSSSDSIEFIPGDLYWIDTEYTYLDQPIGYNRMIGKVVETDGQPSIYFNNQEILLECDGTISATINSPGTSSIKIVSLRKILKFEKKNIPFNDIEGTNNIVSGGDAHAEGFETQATNWNAHAEGRGTIASGPNAHAQGRMTISSGAGSHSEGYNTKASGDYGSHAEGYHTTASGKYGAHAEGQETFAQVASSHTEGYMTRTQGFASHAEGAGHEDGFYNTAYGKASHVEGFMTTAEADYSHAEGDNSTASGVASHAEGHVAVASGEYSHAEGDRTTASGNAGSHAEGFKTIASANAAHAEGQLSEAKATTSHAEGYASLASSGYQHVQGKYNVEDSASKYAHIQGWGTSSKRKNIHTVDVNGNAWFLGDVYVKSTSGVNKDSGSKKLVTETDLDSKLDIGTFTAGDLNNAEDGFYRVSTSTTNVPVAGVASIVLSKTWDDNYAFQLASLHNRDYLYYRVKTNGTWGTWKTLYSNSNLSFDRTPSAGSTNPITSGGVYTTIDALTSRIEALESGGGSGGTWQFTFNHRNFSFENGMTWGQFVNSTYNETVWCPECGEESQAFYTDGADGSSIYYTESGDPGSGCGCTPPIRLPMVTDDTVYPMDYDLIMKALSSGGGGGNVTFTYSDGNSDHEFTVPAGTTWGQFISEGDYPMTDCDYGGHETSMFMTYNDASGGEGDDRVCGYCDGVCASCQYVDMGEMKFVYYDDPDEGYVYVYADDDIRDGGYYFAGSEM